VPQIKPRPVAAATLTENAPSLREVVRMTYAMIDTYCASYKRAPRAVDEA
jgi:hypothetical protein